MFWVKNELGRGSIIWGFLLYAGVDRVFDPGKNCGSGKKILGEWAYCVWAWISLYVGSGL